MATALDPRLAEVLKTVTGERKTLNELFRSYEEKMKSQSSWMTRKKLLTEVEFLHALHELVYSELIRKEITRYLDRPLRKDLEVFWLPSPEP